VAVAWIPLGQMMIKEDGLPGQKETGKGRKA